MLRAGQTPHGARPNREGSAAGGGAGGLGAPELEGRSLMSVRSDAPPRGMLVVSGRKSGHTEFGLQVQLLHGPFRFRDEKEGLQFLWFRMARAQQPCVGCGGLRARVSEM